MNNKDINSQLSRMRSLMKFGVNEGKNVAYTGVEYEKVGADGKLYGIVREGAKYYIKTSSNKKGKLAENFDYIGGFRNRKDNEYTSFAEAQKQFDLKMMSINEANAPEKKIMIESWNPDKQEELTVESTDRMRREISRERQIMMNVMRINEKKTQNLAPIAENSTDKDNDGYDFEDAKDPKDSFKNVDKDHEKPGDAEKANKEYEKVTTNEAAEPLAVHDTDCTVCDTYMDKSHGTEVGDSAPFNDASGDSEMKNGVVEENDSMTVDNDDDQNTPEVGVSEVGDGQPFDEKEETQLEEDIDNIDNDADLEDEDILSDEEDDTQDLENTSDVENDDLGLENDLNDEPSDDEPKEDGDLESVIYDLKDEISDLKAQLNAVLNAVGADEPTVDTDEYEDNDLYDDNEEENDDVVEDEMAFESKNNKGVQVYESRAFRKMRMAEAKRNRARKVNEDEMKDFGKHPAYQKKVMSLPNNDMEEKPEYYDMNDDSVRTTEPYGQKIGKGSPFEVDAETIQNAIAESIMRHLGKKMVR